MLYLLPEVFSVFKFLPGEILIYKYVGAFQLSAIFQDILSLKFNRQQMIVLGWGFLLFFVSFDSVGSLYDNFVFNV